MARQQVVVSSFIHQYQNPAFRNQPSIMNMKTTIPLLILLFIDHTTAVSTTVVAKKDSSSSSSWYERTTATAVGGIREDLLFLTGAEDEQEHHDPLTRNLQATQQPEECFTSRKDSYCYKQVTPHSTCSIVNCYNPFLMLLFYSTPSCL